MTTSPRIQLSNNFHLDEFTLSETAARHGIQIRVPPGSPISANLRALCRWFLQPVRDALGPITIRSGYRPKRVNRLVGGSRTSAHIDGLAVDFTVAGMTPYQVCQWISQSTLEFDQCIHEYGQWVHVGLSLKPKKYRNQILTAYKRRSRLPFKKPKTVYVPGLHRIAELPQPPIFLADKAA